MGDGGVFGIFISIKFRILNFLSRFDSRDSQLPEYPDDFDEDDHGEHGDEAPPQFGQGGTAHPFGNNFVQV